MHNLKWQNVLETVDAVLKHAHASLLCEKYLICKKDWTAYLLDIEFYVIVIRVSCCSQLNEVS